MTSPKNRYLLGLACVACALSAACADDAQDSTTPLALEFEAAEYEVPTDDPALVGSNRYPTTKVELAAMGDGYVLEYDLPEGLVGSELALEFSGPRLASGVYQLVGPQGSADCTYAAGALVCHEVFTNLIIDHASVTRYWTARGLAGEALAGRQAVSQLFEDDPIGILRAGP